MARRPRCDEAGSWHHVVNRALSKRPYFETRGDQRAFLALLAREVRWGRLRVHAYCLMTTHFHLLVESPVGELSEAMRVVENVYSRRFNRLRGRDGPLIRARFHSKRVRTDTYRRAVVRYIDRNPVRAALVTRPEHYEFCSASGHISGVGSPWLERSWISRQIEQLGSPAGRRDVAYRRIFGTGSKSDPNSLDELVEERLRSRSELDPLDDLIGAKPAEVRDWLARKATLADGVRIGLPLCSLGVLMRIADADFEEFGPWYIEDRKDVLRGHEVARIALLRDLCSATWEQVTDALQIPVSRARYWRRVHDRLVLQSGVYAERVSRISTRAMRETVAGTARGSLLS